MQWNISWIKNIPWKRSIEYLHQDEYYSPLPQAPTDVEHSKTQHTLHFGIKTVSDTGSSEENNQSISITQITYSEKVHCIHGSHLIDTKNITLAMFKQTFTNHYNMSRLFIEFCRAGAYACVTYFYAQYPEVIDWSIIFVFVLACDMIIGILKSWVLYSDLNPHRFSKKKALIWFASKLAFYTITLWTILMSSFVYWENETFNKSVMWIFLICMFMWVVHNVVQISKKEELPEWNAMAMVFEALYLKIKRIIEWLIEKLSKI